MPAVCCPAVNIPSDVCTALHLQQPRLVQGTGVDVDAVPVGCTAVGQSLVVLGTHTQGLGGCNVQFLLLPTSGQHQEQMGQSPVLW